MTLGAGVGPIIDVTKMLDRHRRVFLGRGQTRVSEKLLDLAQVRPHVQQVGRVAMSQPVGMDPLAEICLRRTIGQDTAGLPRRQPPWRLLPPRPQGDEERLSQDARTPAYVEPLTQGEPGLLWNRHPWGRPFNMLEEDTKGQGAFLRYGPPPPIGEAE